MYKLRTVSEEFWNFTYSINFLLKIQSDELQICQNYKTCSTSESKVLRKLKFSIKRIRIFFKYLLSRDSIMNNVRDVM